MTRLRWISARVMELMQALPFSARDDSDVWRAMTMLATNEWDKTHTI